MSYVDELEKLGFNNGYDTCINVHTRNFDFTLAFIAGETNKNLSILVTDELGREKLKIINKEFIEYIEIVYQDDINVNENEEPKDRMFN